MSVNLHHGHRIVGHSLPSLLPQLQTFRQQLEGLARSKRLRSQVLLAVRAYDAAAVGFTPRADTLSFMESAELKLVERLHEVTQLRHHDPAVDMGFELVLLPVESHLLALSFSGQPEFTKAWEAQTWRRDFAYWDESALPDDVSTPEWHERARLWHLALGTEPRAAAELGYSFVVLRKDAGFGPWDEELIEPHWPSLQTRADMLLTAGVLAELEQRGLAKPTNRAALAQLERGNLGAMIREELLEKLNPTLAVTDLL